jgi:hypothetical protein
VVAQGQWLGGHPCGSSGSALQSGRTGSPACTQVMHINPGCRTTAAGQCMRRMQRGKLGNDASTVFVDMCPWVLLGQRTWRALFAFDAPSHCLPATSQHRWVGSSTHALS